MQVDCNYAQIEEGTPYSVSRDRFSFFLGAVLGMTNFFHHHIPAYSEIAAPLTNMIKGVVPGRRRLLWSLGCQESFERLKEALVSAPVLRHFNPNLRTAVGAKTLWALCSCSGRKGNPRHDLFVSCPASFKGPNTGMMRATLTLWQHSWLWRH